MSFEKWDEFAEFASNSIRLYYEENNTPASFLKTLTNRVSNAIAEIRKILNDDGMHLDLKIRDIDDHYRKIIELKSNLFESRAEVVIYLPDEISIMNGNDREVVSARRLYKSTNRLEGIFAEELNKIKEKQISVHTKAKGRKRIPSRASFELTNKDTNLRAVHRILIDRDHPFITSSYNDFAVAFSGDPVTKKVVWHNQNALHYFIDGIHGKGVKSANEGKWARASRCFQIMDKNSIPRDFTTTQIKDRDDIAGPTSVLLDKAIHHFLK